MPIWFYVVVIALGTFMTYELWRSKARGKIFTGFGDASRGDAPREFAFYRSAYIICLIALLLSTISIALGYGVKV